MLFQNEDLPEFVRSNLLNIDSVFITTKSLNLQIYANREPSFFRTKGHRPQITETVKDRFT